MTRRSGSSVVNRTGFLGDESVAAAFVPAPHDYFGHPLYKKENELC